MQLPSELTIIKDRYGGMYSGGRYTAWNLPFSKIPGLVEGSDLECETFWKAYKAVNQSTNTTIVGFGSTPQSALEDLIKKNEQVKNTQNNFQSCKITKS